MSDKTYKCRHGHTKDCIQDAVACDLREKLIDILMMGKLKGDGAGARLSHWEKIRMPNGHLLAPGWGRLGKQALNTIPDELFKEMSVQAIGDIVDFFAYHLDTAEELLVAAKAEFARQNGDDAADLIKKAAEAGSTTKEGE